MTIEQVKVGTERQSKEAGKWQVCRLGSILSLVCRLESILCLVSKLGMGSVPRHDKQGRRCLSKHSWAMNTSECTR